MLKTVPLLVVPLLVGAVTASAANLNGSSDPSLALTKA